MRRLLARLRAFLGRGALTFGLGGAAAPPAGELDVLVHDVDLARVDLAEAQPVFVGAEDVELVRMTMRDLPRRR